MQLYDLVKMMNIIFARNWIRLHEGKGRIKNILKNFFIPTPTARFCKYGSRVKLKGTIHQQGLVMLNILLVNKLCF